MKQLPSLKHPIYLGKIPSTKQKFQFKPFLVKEQKNLLISLESDDIQHIYASFMEIIESCVISVDNDKTKKMDVKNLPSFDAESVFLQISSRSIGEKTTVRLDCEKCEAENDVDVIINDVQLKNYDPEKQKIQLTDDVGIVLRYPSLNDIIIQENDDNDNKEPETSQVYTTIKNSVVSIYDKETVYPREDIDPEELDEFIDSLSIPQMQKIEKFFEDYPYLSNDVKFKCKSCETINDVEVKGLKDFFF
jgi:hypothetical protein